MDGISGSRVALRPFFFIPKRENFWLKGTLLTQCFSMISKRQLTHRTLEFVGQEFITFLMVSKLTNTSWKLICLLKVAVLKLFIIYNFRLVTDEEKWEVLFLKKWINDYTIVSFVYLYRTHVSWFNLLSCI